MYRKDKNLKKFPTLKLRPAKANRNRLCTSLLGAGNQPFLPDAQISTSSGPLVSEYKGGKPNAKTEFSHFGAFQDYSSQFIFKLWEDPE